MDFIIPSSLKGSKWFLQKNHKKKKKVASYEKLIFTLCKTCAEITYQNKCEHTDDERSFIGIWTTDEVNKAIEKGYKVLKTYEVWHLTKLRMNYSKDTSEGS